jgi:hypothetical protein
MKRIVAALLVAALFVSVAGCGGDTQGGDTGSLSLLVDYSEAMAKVGGYRIEGSIEMESGAVAAGEQSQTIAMEIRADVQNSDGEMRQHMFVTMGDYKVEAYIVDGVYYQNLPGQGWMKMSTGAYNLSQNMSMGVMDAEQMEVMAQLARDAEIVEEDDETIALSFSLDQEYLQASLDLFRKSIEEGGEQFPEEWLQLAEESISDFRAEIRMWLRKADDLVQRMEMSYTMAGLPEMGEVKSYMEMDFLDYGQEIVVELPPEAAQAQEFELTQ